MASVVSHASAGHALARQRIQARGGIRGPALPSPRSSLRLLANATKLQEGVGNVFKVEVNDNVSRPLSNRPDATFSDWLTANGPDVFTLIQLPMGCALVKTGEEPGAGVYAMDIKPIELSFPGISLKVQPRISVSIATTAQGLILESRDATLVGSLDLTERMDFFIRTILKPVAGEVQSTTRIRILADPMAPLSLIPGPVLATTGNLATGAALKIIHSFMLDSILRDFNQWAASPEFRAGRAQALRSVVTVPSRL